MNQLFLFLLAGAPGCGKSTYAQKIVEKNPDGTVLICPDILRLKETGDMSNHSRDSFIFAALIPNLMDDAAGVGKNIVIDATNYCRRNRRGIIKLANELGYKVICGVFRTPVEVCKARNAARDRKVPEWVIEKQFANWQEPELSEGIHSIVEVLPDHET